MSAFRLALRMLRRDWRAGELRILVLAVVVAVGAVTSVNVFTDRIEQALERQANTLLGGDLVVNASQPLPEYFMADADRLGLMSTRAQEFPSMVMAGGESQLVALKAVAEGYPLRGRMRVAEQRFGIERQALGIPAPGTVWAESRLLTQLGIDVGDKLMVGLSELQVAAVITHEPARASGNLFSLAPRLMININDLPATGLVQPASRIRYQQFFAGSAKAVSQYRQMLEPRLEQGQVVLGIENARPEVRTAMQQAKRFLGLAALVSVLLAGVAVAMSIQRFVRAHLDNCAVMRCLGAGQSLISRLYLSQMLMLGILASVLGVLAGYLAQAGLVLILGGLVGTELPAPSLAPAGWGALTGLVTLIGFGAPPLMQLKGVPALRVLRRELGIPRPSSLVAYLMGVSALSLLIFVQAGDFRLTAYALGGTAAALLLLGGLAVLLVRVLKSVRSRVGVAWRFGLANISRRGGASVVQVVGFGLGIMALLLLTLVRADLLGLWQGRLPADAPNRFLINIQPQQVEAVARFLSAEGLHETRLHPMVRGRLISVNGQSVSADDYGDERAKRLVEREFNLSWAAKLQEDNEIVAGRWWIPADHGQPVISVEEGIAKTLAINLNDRLTYRVGSVEFSARVASLRTVEWDSFRVNFFVLAPPGFLDDYPATFITSLYLPEQRQPLLNSLVRQFPNITVIDVNSLMQQVRDIIERVTLAVEYVFLFTLLAGLMVMYAAVHATMDERIQETAILRTLGARRDQLLKGLMAEFAGLGLLAGVVAAAAASLTGYVLAEQVFNLPYVPNVTIWLAGLLIGVLGIGVAGTLSTRSILEQPPLWTLRRQ